jgi:hypothetical protein
VITFPTLQLSRNPGLHYLLCPTAFLLFLGQRVNVVLSFLGRRTRNLVLWKFLVLMMYRRMLFSGYGRRGAAAAMQLWRVDLFKQIKLFKRF